MKNIRLKVISTNSGPKVCYEATSSTDINTQTTLKHTVCKGEDINAKNVKERKLQTYAKAIEFCGPDGLSNLEITKIEQKDFYPIPFWTGVSGVLC